jgi:SpoIIAA-like
MVERIDGMPAGTVGLRAAGKLSRDDYREVLEPVLNEATESGEMRLVFVLTDFDGLEPGAWIEDAKTGLRVWVRDHAAWKRFALVTDVEWVAKAMRLFAWMAPGEVKTFDLDQEDEARTWVAG